MLSAKRCKRWEREPRILAAGLATVQPWLDIPGLGSAVVVVTDGDADLARERCARTGGVGLGAAARLSAGAGVGGGRRAGRVRRAGRPGRPQRQRRRHDVRRARRQHPAAPRDAEVRLAAARPGHAGRSRTGGGGGASAASGRSSRRSLGGKRDSRFSTPLPAAVRVARLFDARFVMSGHLARNLPIDMGPSAVLRIGNVHIVVTSRSGPHFARSCSRPPASIRSRRSCSSPRARAASGRRTRRGPSRSSWCARPAAPRRLLALSVSATSRGRCGRGTRSRNGRRPRRWLRAERAVASP